MSAPVGEVGQSRQAGAVPSWPDLPVGDWTALLDCCFRHLGRPMSCALSAWAEPLRESRSVRDPRFMNPIDCDAKSLHRHVAELIRATVGSIGRVEAGEAVMGAGGGVGGGGVEDEGGEASGGSGTGGEEWGWLATAENARVGEWRNDDGRHRRG